MKIFVTGAGGQLGYDVMKELGGRGHKCVGSDILSGDKPAPPYIDEQLDITDKEAVEAALVSHRPDAVIHCAAWTAVDAAEEARNQARVFAVNADGTRTIAEVCKMLDCKMLYISTDYVFDGRGTDPWQADSKDYAPLNAYGRSKLAGELAVAETLGKYFIVRTSWAFGKNGSNFIRTMLDVGRRHSELRVVNDQIGTPTYTLDLARLLVDMVESNKYGYYHATNEGGYISWHDLACEIFMQAGYDVKVTPVTTKEYGLSKAARPLNSRLDKDKLSQNGFETLPVWQDALARYLREIGVLKE